jgi:signal transduction histidine kinase
MTQYGHAMIGLTVLVAMLVGVMVFALLRFASAARSAKRGPRETGTETTLLSAALQEAVARLETQQRAALISQQLSAQIVESLIAGLLVVDGSGAIEIFNPAGRRMLDVGAVSAGSHYRDVLSRAPQLVAVIEEALASSEAMARRTVEVSTSERTLHFGVTISPLRDPTRAAQAVICLFSDLTAVKELEEQLRLKDTLARLGVLTAGIAHEFRNGLATIHGYGRLIDPQALPAKYQPYVEGIRQEADALGKIVANFLNFARPAQVAMVPVDLGAIAQRAADDLQHDLPAGTQVTVEGEFGPMLGDDVLLRQVFGNLIRNAAEACVQAGRVPVLRIVGVVDSGTLTSRVSVDDNGPGVKESDRESIFEPFVTTRSRGTGLGLAIVQKVVVMHNGRISIGSSPDGGASFQLAFPLAAA